MPQGTDHDFEPALVSTQDRLFEISLRLERIDERAKSLDAAVVSLVDSVKEVRNDIKESSKSSKEDMDKNYVKKTEFDPIRRLVYGVVGAALIAFGGIFISIINKSIDISWVNPRLIATQQSQQQLNNVGKPQ